MSTQSTNPLAATTISAASYSTEAFSPDSKLAYLKASNYFLAGVVAKLRDRAITDEKTSQASNQLTINCLHLDLARADAQQINQPPGEKEEVCRYIALGIEFGERIQHKFKDGDPAAPWSIVERIGMFALGAFVAATRHPLQAFPFITPEIVDDISRGLTLEDKYNADKLVKADEAKKADQEFAQCLKDDPKSVIDAFQFPSAKYAHHETFIIPKHRGSRDAIVYLKKLLQKNQSYFDPKKSLQIQEAGFAVGQYHAADNLHDTFYLLVSGGYFEAVDFVKLVEVLKDHLTDDVYQTTLGAAAEHNHHRLPTSTSYRLMQSFQHSDLMGSKEQL